MAAENLQIAQHPNTLTHVYTRSDSYKPKVRQDEVGDFVYLQRKSNDTLNTSTSRTHLPIETIRTLDVLELQGIDKCIF